MFRKSSVAILLDLIQWVGFDLYKNLSWLKDIPSKVRKVARCNYPGDYNLRLWFKIDQWTKTENKPYFCNASRRTYIVLLNGNHYSQTIENILYSLTNSHSNFWAWFCLWKAYPKPWHANHPIVSRWNHSTTKQLQRFSSLTLNRSWRTNTGMKGIFSSLSYHPGHI